MPIYEITKFSGGISDYDDRGIPGAFKFAKNLDIRKKVDSISAGQALEDEGIVADLASQSISASLSISPSSSVSSSVSLSPSASPSATASHSLSRSPSASRSPSSSLSPSSSASPSISVSQALTTVFRDLIRFFVKASDGFTYGFGNTGYVYRRDSEANWTRLYKDSDGTIKGACEKPSSDGKVYLIWATNRTVKMKPIPGASNWNDVIHVNASGAQLESEDWHTMTQVGGAAYICNGPLIALVGYDNSYTNEALQLIPGNTSKTLVERNGRVIIGTGRKSNPTKSINGAVDAEVPIAQVGDDGDLYFADMNASIPIKRLPGGGKVNPGGMANQVEQVNFFEWEETALSYIDKQSVGNMALMAVYNADDGYGGVYTYGRKEKNDPLVLNLEYALDADELGAVTDVEGTVLVSYREGSDFGVKASDPTEKATGTYEGLDFKAPVKKPAEITVWRQAEIFMKPLPSGCSVQFHYKINKTGSFVQARTADDDTDYDTALGKKAVFRIEAEGEIFEPKIVIVPSGNNTPEVHRVRIYFN